MIQYEAPTYMRKLFQIRSDLKDAESELTHWKAEAERLRKENERLQADVMRLANRNGYLCDRLEKLAGGIEEMRLL
jgi:chromosome segregation ATPase